MIFFRGASLDKHPVLHDVHALACVDQYHAFPRAAICNAALQLLHTLDIMQRIQMLQDIRPHRSRLTATPFAETPAVIPIP